ncbi:MAG: PTS sugar transporter subunit IIA [Desulfohalobiaceae bacterium]|nr:PTS sugar transporter subunit IIA [Desulfohalobiaceae bacterium]
MVGVLLVAHSDFGEGLLRAAEGILGTQERCVPISVSHTKSMQSIIEEIESAVKAVDNGDGVIILTDMFGGTPSNLSLSLLGTTRVEVITGANMPMLLKILGSRHIPLSEIAAEAKSAGRQGIVVAGEVLKRKIGSKKK